MSDHLRDRIAAVLASVEVVLDGDNLNQTSAWLLADAVIAALGLEPQVHYDPDCEFYRYVTDWIDPQTNQRVDLP